MQVSLIWEAALLSVVVAAQQLKINLINNGGDTLNAYVTGQDSNGKACMLGTDGAWVYPEAGGTSTPNLVTSSVTHAVAATAISTLTLPDYIVSGRIWLAAGELKFYTVMGSNGSTSVVQPSAVNPSDASYNISWGFAELTNTKDGGIYANISFVDWVGMLIGMALTTKNGAKQTVPGLHANSLPSICSALQKQAETDGQPWDKLCIAGPNNSPLRILSPNVYLATSPSAMSSYYSSYIDSVWSKYTSRSLTFNTQSSAGNVSCTVSSSTNELSCAGDSRAFAKPSIADIWGCNSGTFAIQSGDTDVHKAVIPRLCAALHRSTLLLDGGDVQPSAKVGNGTYYGESPTNHYSRIVHDHLASGRGYAFSYDDVNPDDQNAAGVVAGMDPTLLELTIGGA